MKLNHEQNDSKSISILIARKVNNKVAIKGIMQKYKCWKLEAFINFNAQNSFLPLLEYYVVIPETTI
jgi:hypothetical protein